MPTITDVQIRLQKLTNEKITYTAIGKVLGTGKANISARAKSNSTVTEKEIRLLEDAYNVDLMSVIKQQLSEIHEAVKDSNIARIIYRPDVRFSAGYGVEVFEDGTAEYIALDLSLLKTDKGFKINPKYCELLTVSGNSMYPKWEDGDRFILDKSVTNFIDGQIFAFKLNGECYIKEICLLGQRAKAIPINKEYDEFYIEPEDELIIFGRVLPRVRL